MKKGDLDGVEKYYELIVIADKHGIKKEVDIILWDNSEADNRSLDDAMQSLAKLKKHLTKLNDLDCWLSHETENLTEADIRLQNRLDKENQKAVIVKRIKAQSQRAVNRRLKEDRQRRNRHLISRMGNLISSGLSTRDAANAVYKKEVAEGRTDIVKRTILRIYYDRNK